jgi:allantoin racemase
MAQILLMNPNSNARVTAAMCAIAARALPAAPVGWTAPRGPQLIVTPKALRLAAQEVATADLPLWPDAIIVSAFGDPGADRLALRAPCPVLGIGAAAARTASRAGTTFAVATTTPSLSPLIDTLMRRHAGGGRYLGCYCSQDEPAALMSDQTALDAALLGCIEKAHADGAEHVIIGGGPLGEAAERLRDKSPATLINPILCAAREVANELGADHD